MSAQEGPMHQCPRNGDRYHLPAGERCTECGEVAGVPMLGALGPAGRERAAVVVWLREMAHRHRLAQADHLADGAIVVASLIGAMADEATQQANAIERGEHVGEK